MKRNAFISISACWRHMLSSALLAGGSVLTGPAAGAEPYPGKTITLVVPYAAGGGVDTVGRLVALELQKQLNQTVVVENRAGGGAGIGASHVARAPADGYTLLVGDPALITNAVLTPGFPVRLDKDLQPVSILTASPLVLSVAVTSPVKSVAELIAEGRRVPQGLSFSSAGVGSTPHLAGELLKFLTKGNFTHVPYKGSAPAIADLVGGRIDFAFATQAASSGMVKGGKLRPLATTGTDRAASEFPDLPTMAEALPGFRVVFWTGLFAPAGTPADVVKKLDEAVRASWQSASVQGALRSAGDRASYVPADKAVAFVRAENEALNRLIRDAKIQGE